MKTTCNRSAIAALWHSHRRFIASAYPIQVFPGLSTTINAPPLRPLAAKAASAWPAKGRVARVGSTSVGRDNRPLHVI